MKKNTILSNFKPILVGKLVDQKLLNAYMGFMYEKFQVQNESKLVAVGDNQNFENEECKSLISALVEKYAVSSEYINKRQILLFDELNDFIENEMESTPVSDYPLPATFVKDSNNNFIPKIGDRMAWFNSKMDQVFDKFYEEESIVCPENMVHVSCSGYSSPSVAQKAVISRKWENTQVTHSYQMGCYGAFPAIRTAKGLLASSENNGRVDIVHTELLSAHLNLTEVSPANTMICSLFADGFIGYSMYEEQSFLNDPSISDKKGLKIIF